MVSCTTYAGPETKIQIPFPKFVTRPSATTLYCNGVLNTELRGLNENYMPGEKSPARITGDISKVTQSDKVKIVFKSTGVMVSTSMPTPKGGYIFGPEFPYKILNDDPTNFFAIQDRTKDTMTMLQIISVNREAGTMIWSSEESSLPTGGHPWVSSTFFVCSPTE
jgi:hypothetical protein